MRRGRRASSRFRPTSKRRLPDGTWQRIPDDAGFPAGLERTIVVDLTRQAARGRAAHPADDQSARFTGTRCSSIKARDAEARTTEVPLASATLHFRGYPKQIEGASPGDLDYDYDRVSLTGPFQHERGNYTHMGDVTALRERHRRSLCDLRQRRRDRRRVRRCEAARAACRTGSATTSSMPTAT